MPRLAVFVSGGGSNFQAIQRAILQGGIRAEVVAVVTNAPSCGGAAYARQQDIPVLTYPAPAADPAAGLSEEQLVQELTKVSVANPFEEGFLWFCALFMQSGGQK